MSNKLKKSYSQISRIINVLLGHRFRIAIYKLISINSYWFNAKFRPEKCLAVMSIETTIEQIILQNLSVIRFGDGEIEIMNGHDIAFQPFHEKLKDELISAAQVKSKSILICIPDIFQDLSAKNYRAQIFWKCHLQKYRKYWLRYFNSQSIYGNAYISRLYIDWIDKNQVKTWFDNIKKIWESRNIVILEGSETRLGVGNDLFSKCKSVKRIICPPRDAFEKFDLIIQSACNFERGKLILIALGPCAKPVVLSLHRLGFQAIDVGHIDIEYEWFLAGTTEKIPIDGKFVNEVATDKFIDECLDIEYLKQIDYVVK
jgi:glycosyltransferase family protein